MNASLEVTSDLITDAASGIPPLARREPELEGHPDPALSGGDLGSTEGAWRIAYKCLPADPMVFRNGQDV
jgi:hypothetical protein